MRTKQIRRIIQQAFATEKTTGNLRKAIIGVARLRGVQLNEPQLNGVIRFIREYIEHVPGLIDQIYAHAKGKGVIDQISPILEAAEGYFIAPLDVIPDQLGLLGLVDDAYLANTLMQEISNSFKDKQQKSLFPMDMTQANLFIRNMIGEPEASMLDTGVLNVLNGPVIQQTLADFSFSSASFQVTEPDPIWGNATMDEIVDARLGALGVV